MQLPSSCPIAIRDLGVRDQPYWQAGSDDGIRLQLEDGEIPPRVGWCRAEGSGPVRWALPDQTTIGVTNRRIAFITQNFDAGGGWAGFGTVGLLVSVGANAISKSRARKRSEGKVAIGHVRHEWILEVRLRKVKAVFGPVDTYVDITYLTESGLSTIELWGRGLANEDFAYWLTNVVAYERLNGAPGLTDEDREYLQRLCAPGGPAGYGSGDRWLFPGDVEAMIAAGHAALEQR